MRSPTKAGSARKRPAPTAAEMGRKGGQSKSPAKIAAVLKNLEKARAQRKRYVDDEAF